MVSALDLVLAGGVYIPPEILAREQHPSANPELPCIAPGARPVRPADLGLTSRQADVLELMMTGKSNKEISRRLNLALPTVKNHVTAVLKAIKVTNRTAAVIAIANLGVEWRQSMIRSS
jgi:DNA-binding NarL/FixJ family response regulator